MSVIIESISERILSEVADVHLEAFKGYMNASLGRQYVLRFLSWFAHRKDGIALAAILDARVVGYVVGAPVGYNRTMNRDLFWVVASGIALRPWLLFQKRFIKRVIQRGGQLLSRDPADRAAVPNLPEPVMSLVGIGVSQAGRGVGVGRALINEFERRCRQAQMKGMLLSVYSGNNEARSFYERAGWIPVVPEHTVDALYYYRPIEASNVPASPA